MPGADVADRQGAETLLDDRIVERVEDGRVADGLLELIPVVPHERGAQDVQGLVEGRILRRVDKVGFEGAYGHPLGRGPAASKNPTAVDLEVKGATSLLGHVVPPSPQHLPAGVVGRDREPRADGEDLRGLGRRPPWRGRRGQAARRQHLQERAPIVSVC